MSAPQLVQVVERILDRHAPDVAESDDRGQIAQLVFMERALDVDVVLVDRS